MENFTLHYQMGNPSARNGFNFTCLLFFFIHIISCVDDESLDAILHDRAFQAMMIHRHRHPRTGALYNATLPANLAGVKASVMGLRTTTLWRNGTNFSGVMIPPQTLPVPHVRRILIVYHDLANWSSIYYNLTGYSLATPVVGFLVYDATQLRSKNLSKLELNTMGKPISIKFQDSVAISNGRARCAYFGAFGRVVLSEKGLPNVCYSTSQGHFSIVIPGKKKQKVWPFWIMASLAGFVGLVLVGLARSCIGKRNQEMEKEADEGECLQTYWIASSKMPVAEVTRTQPILESTTLPNPNLSWYA